MLLPLRERLVDALDDALGRGVLAKGLAERAVRVEEVKVDAVRGEQERRHRSARRHEVANEREGRPVVDKVVVRRLRVGRGREVDTEDLAHVLDCVVRAGQANSTRMKLWRTGGASEQDVRSSSA